MAYCDIFFYLMNVFKLLSKFLKVYEVGTFQIQMKRYFMGYKCYWHFA